MSIFVDVEVMHEFTDECSAQYKSQKCLVDTCRSELHVHVGYKVLIQNFYEMSHAKKDPHHFASGFYTCFLYFFYCTGVFLFRATVIVIKIL